MKDSTFFLANYVQQLWFHNRFLSIELENYFTFLLLNKNALRTLQHKESSSLSPQINYIHLFSPLILTVSVLHRLISVPLTFRNELAATGPIRNSSICWQSLNIEAWCTVGSWTLAGLWNRELVYLERTIVACKCGWGFARTPSVTATCWQESKERRSQASVYLGE